MRAGDRGETGPAGALTVDVQPPGPETTSACRLSRPARGTWTAARAASLVAHRRLRSLVMRSE